MKPGGSTMGKTRSISKGLLAVLIIAGLLVGGCGNPEKNTEKIADGPNRSFEFGRQYMSDVLDFSFSHPSEWEPVRETFQNGVLTLRLQDRNGNLQLVVTVLPEVLEWNALMVEAEKLVRSSLYRPGELMEYEEKDIEGRLTGFITATAGERETVLARTALFTGSGKSCLFTLVAVEESFTEGAGILEQILLTVDL